MLARFNLPRGIPFLIWLLIAVVVIILVAMVVHALGGFDWNLKIGYFRMGIGVT